MVLGICRRILRNAADADDAFQATFLLLAMKARSIREPGLLGNWLFGVATRIALQSRRATARRIVQEQRLMANLGARRQATTDDADLRMTLDEQIAKLPDRLRRVIVCCHLEGFTKREAAKRLNWAESTVTARLKQARALLKQRLAGKGFPIADDILGAILAPVVVPTALHALTVKTATAFAVGKLATAGAASAKALTMARGAGNAMMIAKAKLAAIVLIASTAAAIGTVAVAQQKPPLPPPVNNLAASNPATQMSQPGDTLSAMRQAGINLFIYANKHGGKFPPDLQAIHASGRFEYLANGSVRPGTIKQPARLILLSEVVAPGNVAPVGVIFFDGAGFVRLPAAEAEEWRADSKAYFDAIKQSADGSVLPPPPVELPPPQFPRSNLLLPEDVRTALVRIDAGLKPIKLGWTRNASSRLGEEAAKSKYFVEPFFFRKSSSRAALDPGKMYFWSNGTRGNDAFEFAIDGETYSWASGAPNYQTGQEYLAHMSRFNQFSCEYLDWAGLSMPMRPAELKSVGPAGQILRRLAAGASLVSVSDVVLEDRPMKRIELIDVNPERVRLHALPPTRNFIYYLDPQLHFALRRIDECYDRKPIVRITCNQLTQLPGRDIWLAHEIVRDHFTYRMIPDQFFSEPILTETLELTEVSTGVLPAGQFVLSTRVASRSNPQGPPPGSEPLASVTPAAPPIERSSFAIWMGVGLIIAIAGVIWFGLRKAQMRR
jgi:RNA polymerase sigma factor (sigma-70 family)